MRILKLGVYSASYLDQFYRARPDLERADYATQHAALMHDAFASADFWTSALQTLGHVTTDLVINAEPLQRAWAREHRLSWPGAGWPFAVGLEQVKAFQPAVLLVADYSTVTYEFLRQLQSDCPSIRLTLIWCGAPYRNADVFRACDIVLSCVPELVDDFRQQGHRAEHINHAFEPRLVERLPRITQPSVDFSFLGSVVLSGSFHRERARILDVLVRDTSLAIWSDVSLPSVRTRAGQRARIIAFDAAATARELGIPRQALSSIPLIGRAARWPVRPESIETIGQRVVRRAQRPLYGLAMFGKLRESRVTLNTHIEVSRHSASNMRMFEATGVGTCLLTDRKERLSDLFEPDAEVATYASAAECVEKVRYLLEHESERASIAAAGQRRTLRDHTFAHRAAHLDAILHDALSGKPKRTSAVIESPKSIRSIATRIRQVFRGRGKASASFEEVERAERQFYLDFVRDGMVVFDVGAHVGELTLLFSRCAGSGQVHAFEAGRRSFERLSAVCRDRRNVLLHHVAVSDREGEIALHVYDDAHLAWSTQAERPLANYGIDVKPIAIERVPSITLDHYCQRHDIAHIDLLKIDVEGAELQVLLGAKQLLAEQRIHCLTFEFGQTTFDMGNTPDAIEDLLERNGYTIRNIVDGDATFPGRESPRTAQFAMHVATVTRRT
jgi:spore maturation protein CgeB